MWSIAHKFVSSLSLSAAHLLTDGSGNCHSFGSGEVFADYVLVVLRLQQLADVQDAHADHVVVQFLARFEPSQPGDELIVARSVARWKRSDDDRVKQTKGVD